MAPARLLVLPLVCAVATSGCAFLRGYAEADDSVSRSLAAAPSPGLARLLFDDFQGLSTDTMQRSAVPWKLLAAGSLSVARQSNPSQELSEAAFNRLLVERYGFVMPSRVANWPEAAAQPVFTKPMGVVSGLVRRSLPAVELETMNLGCSTCHSGRLFDADGRATDEVWVGLPSSTINPEAFAQGAWTALKWSAEHPQEALAAVKTTFPGVSEVELHSLEAYYLPDLAKRVGELDANLHRFTPYSNGGTGLTNGAATVQYYLGWLARDHFHAEQAGFTSVPTLAAVRRQRAYLCDAVYAPPGQPHTGRLDANPTAPERAALARLTTLVTVGTLGVDPAVAPSNARRMEDVVAYLVDEHVAPPFPGPIDAALADEGATLYARRCADCHGTVERTAKGTRAASFPNDVTPQEKMGTDGVRAAMVTRKLEADFRETPLAQVADARGQGGYRAQPLTGLWATAPYLHNGSVPTLWHFLHPEARPERFEATSRRLDYARVGLALEPAADGVWRAPPGPQLAGGPLTEVMDTTRPGKGRQGHEAQLEGLSEADKRALLEYLKRL